MIGSATEIGSARASAKQARSEKKTRKRSPRRPRSATLRLRRVLDHARTIPHLVATAPSFLGRGILTQCHQSCDSLISPTETFAKVSIKDPSSLLSEASGYRPFPVAVRRAESKDLSAFSRDNQWRVRPRCQRPIRRRPLDGHVILMRGASFVPHRSFDSARPNQWKKQVPPSPHS